MPGGLVALLDDISVIARAAAASIDDVGIAAGKAGAQGGRGGDRRCGGYAGLCHRPVAGARIADHRQDRTRQPDQQAADIAARRAAAERIPALRDPLPADGGRAYLCYEGAEKLAEKLGEEKHGATLEDPITDLAAFEKARISGAIRTDLILSAEIMAITLNEVAAEDLLTRGGVLAVVGIAITVLVYGAVGLIVKMDDVGLYLSKKPSAAARGPGGRCSRRCHKCWCY